MDIELTEPHSRDERSMNDEPGALTPSRAPILGAKRAFYSLIAFLIPQVAAGVIVGLAGFFSSSADRTASRHAPGTAALILAVFVGVILGGLIVLHDVRRSMPGPIRSGVLLPIGWMGARTRDLWLSASVGVLLVLLYMGAVAIFPPAPGQKYGVVSELLSSGGTALHIWALGAVLVSPPVEEFVFRGVLFTGFSRSWGVLAASILVTVLFLLLHLSETVHYLPALLVQALFASAAIVARIATRSLLPSIVLHATYNVGAVAIVYLSRSILR